MQGCGGSVRCGLQVRVCIRPGPQSIRHVSYVACSACRAADWFIGCFVGWFVGRRRRGPETGHEVGAALGVAVLSAVASTAGSLAGLEGVAAGFSRGLFAGGTYAMTYAARYPSGSPAWCCWTARAPNSSPGCHYRETRTRNPAI